MHRRDNPQKMLTTIAILSSNNNTGTAKDNAMINLQKKVENVDSHISRPVCLFSLSSENNEEIKQFNSDIRVTGYLKQKRGEIIVCAPKTHVKVNLNEIVIIATIPGEGKDRARTGRSWGDSGYSARRW